MTKPKLCVCGHQQIRHAGWNRLGRCNECRYDKRNSSDPCEQFRLDVTP